MFDQTKTPIVETLQNFDQEPCLAICVKKKVNDPQQSHIEDILQA